MRINRINKKSVKLGMADALRWVDKFLSPCLLLIIADFESVTRSAIGGVL